MVTRAQRLEINRINASKSTGPKSLIGLQIASRNSMTHGLTAEVLALSTEDENVVAEQLNVWVDYYQPANPAEALLVENMAKAALTLRRCSVHETAFLNDQIENVPLRMMADAEDRLAELREGLVDDPEGSVRELERSFHGVDWMLGRWAVLQETVQRNGGFFGYSPVTHEAVRLLGCDPRPDPQREFLAKFVSNERIHREYFVLEGRTIPDPELARSTVSLIVRDEIARLEQLRKELQQELVLKLAREKQMAVVPADGPDARLFLRYHKEAELSFHRNYKALMRAQEERLAEALEGEDDSTVEAAFVSPVSDPSEAVSRNEANPPNEPPSNGIIQTSCGESSVSVSVPSNGAVQVPSTAVEPAAVNSSLAAPAIVPVPSTVPPRQRLVSA
jgi:hypothetical protein